MKFSEISAIVSGEVLSAVNPEEEIRSLLTDSRKPFMPKGVLFFAVHGQHHDGHAYISDLVKRGVSNFVVEKEIKGIDANMVRVASATAALQAIAQYHREQFDLQVIGITGSNGKTIVKEWLYACLAPYFRIVRSPRSYNSQIGVPLSVWEINEVHNLGIFEAGISQPDEMSKLQRVIQPTIGIFTNLGSAHDEGFESREQKLTEKAKLFKDTETVIACADHKALEFLTDKAFYWGKSERAALRVMKLVKETNYTEVHLKYQQQDFNFTLPFTEDASIENCMHCIATMVFMDFTPMVIQSRINHLLSVPMRLEMKNAQGGSLLIDDSYNNDLGGFHRAIDFLVAQKQRDRKVVILSDIAQSGLTPEALYAEVAAKVKAADIDLFIGIGSSLCTQAKLFEQAQFYPSTEAFLQDIDDEDLADSLILLKGARPFAFEKIGKRLEEKIHGTVLEISLDALTNNLNYYRSSIAPETGIMVMVKAFAYGSGSHEIANLMQFHRVNYLGVAYADEGVHLRQNGIYLPIMVMNPSVESFEIILKHDLEPEMYNREILRDFVRYLNGRPARIHLKIDTGMRRLGFEADDLDELISVLKANENLEVKTIFSHLAGADEDEHNAFSHQQAATFKALSDKIMAELPNQPMRHLVNSPGILRFPEYHFDMVRLGIGLYGLEANNQAQDKLQNISTLKTVVSQVKKVKAGETVGYGRKGVAAHDMEIATIAIGYADGFSRAFSTGVGEVFIKGKRAKVMGNVCMDMTMIDVTGMGVQVHDEVEIFGPNISISELAKKIGTIPYEILTNVSQRVKRVYHTE